MRARQWLGRIAAAMLGVVGLVGLSAAVDVPPASAAFGVVPEWTCVTYDSFANMMAVYWGYNNRNTSAVSIDSAFNFFIPSPSSRNQPLSFQPGDHPYAFATVSSASDSLTWVLGEYAVTAENDPSQYCSNPPPLASPDMTATPSSLAFGDVAVGGTSISQTVTLSTTDTAVIGYEGIYRAVTLAGPGDAYFAVTTGPCSVTIDTTSTTASAASCTYTVTFTPIGVGLQQATLEVTVPDARAPLTIPLSGVGLPSITSVTPPTGTTIGGSAVTISGTGFDTAPGATAVLFGSELAPSLDCPTATTCHAVAPAAAAGPVAVKVVVDGVASTTTATFDYVTTGSPPTTPAPTTTTVRVSPASVTSGASVAYSATVTSSAGTPTGAVAFSVGATSLCTAALSEGEATCDATTAPVGTDTVTAAYRGDASDTGSSGTTTLVVTAPTPAPTTTTVRVSPASVTSGASVAYSATVTSSAGTPTGAVAFSVGATSLCTAALSEGEATCDATTAPVGTDTVTAAYRGDASDTGSSGTTTLVVTAPTPAPTTTTSNVGYREVASDGGIFSFGTAAFYGSEGGKPLDSPVVGMAVTPTGKGYWLVASDGGIFSFGTAAFYGSEGGKPLDSPVVGMAAAPTGKGYWLVASDGGIFSFGTAAFYGSEGGKPLDSPVVGMAAAPTGKGYWLVASDGGIFSFGTAAFYGSEGGKPLDAPVVGMAAAPTGKGYWEVAKDGGIFSFGTAAFYGSEGGKPLNAPVVGMAAAPTGKGYWEVAKDGGIFSFGTAAFYGSEGGKPLNAPVVGMAPGA